MENHLKIHPTCSRFHSFLLFLGQPSASVRDIKVTCFCRIISEFSLEYRTTRERVVTLKRKRAAHRERTKTRGKMITEVTTEFCHINLSRLNHIRLHLTDGPFSSSSSPFFLPPPFPFTPPLSVFLPISQRSFRGLCLTPTPNPGIPWQWRLSLVKRRSMRI